MSFAHRKHNNGDDDDDDGPVDDLCDDILHQAGFCSTASCNQYSSFDGDALKQTEESVDVKDTSSRLAGLATSCNKEESENGDPIEQGEGDLRGFSNIPQTTQYGPLTHVSDLDSSDTDTGEGGENETRGNRRRENLLVELRKNTTPLSRSTANELERIRFSSRFTSFSTLSELNNMAISQGRMIDSFCM